MSSVKSTSQGPFAAGNATRSASGRRASHELTDLISSVAALRGTRGVKDKDNSSSGSVIAGASSDGKAHSFAGWAERDHDLACLARRVRGARFSLSASFARRGGETGATRTSREEDDGVTAVVSLSRRSMKTSNPG